MITFKLENKIAETMLSVLNASNPHATFVEELNTQFFEQTVVDVIEAPVVEAAPVVEEVVEEAPAPKKSKVKNEE